MANTFMEPVEKAGFPALIRRLLATTVALLASFLALQTRAQTQDAENSSVSTSIHVTSEALAAQPVGANWLSYNGDYTGRRFSNLEQITPKNVEQLRAQWVFHVSNSNSMEVTPVVFDGIMFITSANDAFALDAQTGRLIWHYSRPITEGLIDDASQHHNRGVGILGSHLYMETDNAHLLCLDARSGHLLWDVPYAEGNKNYGATSAPLVVKDNVLVGTSGGDDGVRGFLAAFDAETGKEVWRFWTIPGPGEFGSESWPGELYKRGGGTTWMPGTYDPELNTIYWCTSNPAPDFDGGPRPGDDLYTDSVLALDPDTGKLKWYFQFTPHDLYDYDATETPVLIDTNYRGQPRKLLVQANRNGFFYVLDRTSGKFLSAFPFVEKLNWAKGIDAQGRPIRTGVQPTAEGTRTCPGFIGATNWYSPSYNPSTHLFYFLASENCLSRPIAMDFSTFWTARMGNSFPLFHSWKSSIGRRALMRRDVRFGPACNPRQRARARVLDSSGPPTGTRLLTIPRLTCSISLRAKTAMCFC